MSNFVDLQFNENVLKINQNGGGIKFEFHSVSQDPIDVFNQEGKDISTFAGLKDAWDEWASGIPNEFTILIGGKTYALSENSVHFHPHGDFDSEKVGTYDFYYKIPIDENKNFKWRKVVLRIRMVLDGKPGGSMSLIGGANLNQLAALGLTQENIGAIASVMSGLSTSDVNLFNNAFDEMVQNQAALGVCAINPSVVAPVSTGVGAVNTSVVAPVSTGVGTVNTSVVAPVSTGVGAVNTSVVAPVSAPVPANAHLTETFRKLVTPTGEFGGVGGTNENPIGYVNFNEPGSAEQLLYFKVPTIHSYRKTDSTIDTICFKLPSGLIDNLPDHIKNRKNPGYDNEFYFVITCIDFGIITALMEPDKALLQRPHYYYMGNSTLNVDESDNWSSGASDFNLNYSHGVWGQGLTVGNVSGGPASSPIINNTDLSNPITRHSIHAHNHLISPANSYFYLSDVVDNTDINKTIWTFVTGQDDATSNGDQGPIKFNKNRKNVFTLHWLLDPTKFEDLKTATHSGVINNLQQLYDQSTALALLNNAPNRTNVETALGM